MSEVTSRAVGTARKKYIIAKNPLRAASVDEPDLNAVVRDLEGFAKELRAMTVGEDAEPVVMTPLSAPDTQGVHRIEAELTDEHVKALKAKFGAGLTIEEDTPLELFDSGGMFDLAQNMASSASSDTLSVVVSVKAPDGSAVSNASVMLFGEVWSDRQLTNTQGNATLKLHGETLQTLSELRIKPKDSFWSKVIKMPALQERGNTVTLQPLPTSKDDPQIDTWGTEAMGIVAMPNNGPVVKVAVIDSGLSGDHPDLDPAGGMSMGEGGDPAEDWKNDGSGHGTHVSGTVGALNNAFGVRGVADRVAIHSYQIFPQATMSKLLRALDKAIEDQVDVINMSLGGSSSSVVLQERLQAVRNAGILPIAAAGNNGGKVMYPAAYSEVMAVAAVGRVGTFPDDSHHTAHVTGTNTANGAYFAARFTCRGPEIDVCGPGVAVISTVPGKGYSSYDGTSMASPHVAGFAAVKLAQSPAILNMQRSGARAKALFDAVIAACQDLGLEAELQGRGMPVLQGVVPPPAAPAPQPGDDVLADVSDLLARAIAAVKKIKV